MSKLAVLGFAVLLGASLAVSYLVYRQFGTSTVMLSASPRFALTQDGSRCGDVHFVLDARTAGLWLLPVQDAQTLSGVVVVEGDENADIGFRVRTPHNRLAVNEPEPQHRYQFEVPASVRGDYSFEFDNRHSTFTPKRVRVSLCLA